MEMQEGGAVEKEHKGYADVSSHVLRIRSRSHQIATRSSPV